MRKNYFLGALLFISSLGYSQKTIIVNGGQFGNPSENVNVIVYDPILNTQRVVDTIHTSSVQEILFDGQIAYVAAQDSIVAYDLTTETRVAAARFNGVSTKSLAIFGNELLVGNFYGQSSSNLYIYDKSSLTLIDSIAGLTKGVTSILVNGVYAYIPQNSQTLNYTDSLGYIAVVHIPNRWITDTISVPNYTEDIGQIINNPTGNSLLTINSVSNTITKVDYSNFSSASNTLIPLDLNVGGHSQFSEHGDTLFARTANGICALNFNDFSVVDSLVIDTVVTGFTYDTTNAKFYITQTDFFSYQLGKEYGRDGVKIKDFTVGFSPEVIRMYYGFGLSVNEKDIANNVLKVFPNPSVDYISFDLAELNSKHAEMVLISQTGQELLRKNISGTLNQLDLSSYDAGVYFMLLKTGDKVYTSKIIKAN